MTDLESPSVAEWFRSRNVFITGGTGFMGKVLIYKLLLSCHNLGNIFVLVRKKKDVDPRTRLSQMIQQEPFKGMHEKYPERLKKIILIPGDTTADDLALSTTDRKRLIEEVSVIFHMAANVKFDMTLKDAIKINTLGTVNVLTLAKQISNLSAFIHVSTTYCQCTEPVLEERGYVALVKPEIMIQTVNNLTDDVLIAMTPKMLEGQPNTYAFSKALCEELVQQSGLPAAVARPSIVVASLKEPKPGWVDNINGPTGLMIAAGKGVVRTMLCNYNYNLNVIPCDMAINILISLAWKVGIEKPGKPIFMNMTTGSENPVTWKYCVDVGKKHAVTYPFSGVLWYPGGSATTSKIYHWSRVLVFHFLPALVIDALIILTGNKPFLTRVQHRVNAGIEILRYYTTKQWNFRNDGMKQLEQQLNASDRNEFFMNTTSIIWDDYMQRYMLGARHYCLKDDPSTLPRARKVIKCLYYADLFVKIAITLLLVWSVYSWTRPTRELTTTAFDINEI